MFVGNSTYHFFQFFLIYYFNKSPSNKCLDKCFMKVASY